ncbi:MAG TPA: glucosyl-3-phosphoglycerate synthase [Microthrixaceae bacterium]|nr:glucosyl-3-phosphoglycerate synthase [Microthrixaceae bacterium]
MLSTVDDAEHPRVRTFHHREFGVEELVDAKGSTTVSVCIPARNEAATIGQIVETIRAELVEAAPLVDEIVVLDDHSVDRTAQVAAHAGARVVDASTTLSEYGSGHGKGEVLWKSVFASSGDIIVWCDADIIDFGSRFVTGTLGPLLTEPSIQFVKGFYDRPDVDGGGGGRVTELVARPLLSMLFPELGQIHQPLSGEYGGRRSVLERVRFVGGYGVDVCLLIDIVAEVGLAGVAQVDLDVRHHRNRPLDELSPQATAVAQAILHRAAPDLVGDHAMLVRPWRPPTPVDLDEFPPLVGLGAYLARTA